MTDEISFDPEAELPPVIVDAPTRLTSKTPIGSIVWLDASEQSSWTFKVKVREGSPDQELVAHYRVLTSDNMAPRFDLAYPTAGVDGMRDLDFQVKGTSLQEGECHRLELAVSAHFFTGLMPVFFDAVPPGREGEVAYASWTLWEGPGLTEASDFEEARLAQTCGAIEDLLAPTIVEQMP